MGENEIDPEQEAREEYMKKLMSFRRDELVLADDSDDLDDLDDESGSDKSSKDKGIHGVEDAYDIVEKIEDKMSKVAQVIRGMDKRMSYNLRLMGSVIMDPETFKEQVKKNKESARNPSQEIKNEPNMLSIQAAKPGLRTEHEQIIEKSLKDLSVKEKKQKIIPKIKKMQEFAIAKLELESQ